MTNQKLEIKGHAPTLNTVLMVEEMLEHMDESVITVAELKRRLPRKVNHNTLILILEYLDHSNKIAIGVKGITWIRNTSKEMQKAIREGMEL